MARTMCPECRGDIYIEPRCPRCEGAGSVKLLFDPDYYPDGAGRFYFGDARKEKDDESSGVL